MTSWLERARREISKNADQPTANTAERNLTAVTAVSKPGLFGKSRGSNGSNGSSLSGDFSEIETANKAKQDSLSDPAAELRRQKVLCDSPDIRCAMMMDTEADPLLVRCWTPAGHEVFIRARDKDHAAWLAAVNPKREQIPPSDDDTDPLDGQVPYRINVDRHTRLTWMEP